MEFLSEEAFTSLASVVSVGMLDRFVYFLALGLISVIRRLPLGVCFALGQAVGALLWAILPGYRKLARENISAAFGAEMSPAEVRRLVFQHFTTLGANAVSSFKVAAMPLESLTQFAVIENRPYYADVIAKGRGIILAINHIGNWELYAQMAAHEPTFRFGTVYQALRNKPLDDLINEDRRRRGVQTFDRKKGFHAPIALVGELGILGILVDQNAGDGGMWTPFFNRLSSTSPLAATLAIRTGAAVVPAAIYTSGFARWRIVLSPEIPWKEDQPEQLTADINSALEKQIRESPADWFWVHNRWKIPWPNFLTAHQRRGTYLPPDVDPQKLRPFRIVVRSPNWLGDAVMSARAARAFKRGRPDARLAILTPAKLAAFWKSLPEVDEVIPFEPSDSVFAVAGKIRGRFEVAVLFPNSLRSAAEAWLAGIPRRVGYRGHWRARLLNQIVREPKKKKAAKPRHHADRYWHIAEFCGAAEVPPVAASLHSSSTVPLVGICPGAEYGPAKRWPAERYRKAMELINEKTPCSFFILGTAADQPLAAEIAQGFPDTVQDLTGQTSMEELITRLRTLDLLLTNDTGTMHLADSLGVPLISIFGSTEPRLTGPRSLESVVLRKQVECSPCFLRDCPLDFRCMKAIAPEEVAASAWEILSRRRPASRASQ